MVLRVENLVARNLAPLLYYALDQKTKGNEAICSTYFWRKTSLEVDSSCRTIAIRDDEAITYRNCFGFAKRAAFNIESWFVSSVFVSNNMNDISLLDVSLLVRWSTKVGVYRLHRTGWWDSLKYQFFSSFIALYLLLYSNNIRETRVVQEFFLLSMKFIQNTNPTYYVNSCLKIA